MAFNLEKWIRCMAMDALNFECPTKKKSIPISVQTGEFWQVKHDGPNLFVGMATSQVRAVFFHTQTWLASQDLWPEPSPFTKWVFFPRPGTALVGPRGPNLWPNQKNKKNWSPNLFLPIFKPAYSNSSLDNVAQMPSPTKKKKRIEAQIYFCLHSSLQILIQA